MRFTMLILALLATATATRAQPAALTVETQWALATDAAPAGGTVHAAVHFRFEKGFHVQSDRPLDEFLVPTALVLSPPPGIEVRELVYPKPVLFEVVGFDEPLAVFEQEFTIGIALAIAADVAPGMYSLTGSLRYQACDDKICLAPTSLDLRTDLKVVAANEPVTPKPSPWLDGIAFTGVSGAGIAAPDIPPPQDSPATGHAPEDCDVLTELQGFTVLGTAGGYLGAAEFFRFIESAEAGTFQRSALEGKGPIAILLLVIIGGVLLNLTPCVLPLIPINLAIIGAGAKAGSRSRGFALGGTYGLAMAIVYGALGLVVILTASTFGAINSTIWFNVGIAILFIVLGLAMFDVIHIDFSKLQGSFSATNVARRGTFALAFLMGAVSALLAGACVAPVVIQVVVYSGDQYAKGSTMALALPFFLGLGMALPWPFAGAGLSLLPKPGVWMVRIKQVMGVFIVAFAAYYAYLAWEIWDSRRVDPALVHSAVQEQLEGGWTPSLCAGLAQARAENRPVLIDMWATWCKNCLAMDKTTFKDPAVTERLKDFVKVKYQAESLTTSPAREVLAQFEGIGLPTYAILRPRSGGAAATEALSAR
jgi:cytochrome c biogenesis protein CcdA